MSAAEKETVLSKVASSPLPKRRVLRELDIPKSTYYRWLRRGRGLMTGQEVPQRPGTA